MAFLDMKFDDDVETAATAAIRTLGPNGRMLSEDDSEYGFATVRNAYVLAPKGVTIWYGDLNTLDDEDAVKALSKELNLILYVVREQDRFVRTNSSDVVKASVLLAERGRITKNRHVRNPR